jgi:predicted Zn-dependent protease
MFLFETVRMEPLEYPSVIYLNAAQGWLELGDCREAAAELENVAPQFREHPDVLEVKWQIAVKAKGWGEGLTVAEAICRLAPNSPFGWIHRAYCLHELKRTREAWDVLVPAASRFPKEWLICYNLACYGCQLGLLAEGRSWFSRALELGNPNEINRLAADDSDLKPLFQQQL